MREPLPLATIHDAVPGFSAGATMQLCSGSRGECMCLRAR